VEIEMTFTLSIRDETTAGERLDETVLDFLTERITVRELIRSRVYQEVQDYNVGKNSRFRGLVQPLETERQLNPAERREVDWKHQFEVAQEAFQRNGFLILVGDRQVEHLDDEILIEPSTQVSFVRLVPLAGG